MDPLSIAAATAGFLGLVGQLVDGATKLKSVYGTIKNASSGVAELCLEMESLGSLLRQIETRLQGTAVPSLDLQCYQDATRHCDAMRKRTKTMLKKLEAGLQRSRVSALKMPFKKDDIKDMLFGVERAKKSLQLAQESFEG